MHLSQQSIIEAINEGEIMISPLETTNLKPISYTFTNESEVRIQPKEFVIIKSKEIVKFSDNIGGLLSTRGSIAKLGLDCLLSDTIIEPGSEGQLTFCTVNHSNKEVILKAGTPIVKCLFFRPL